MSVWKVTPSNVLTLSSDAYRYIPKAVLTDFYNYCNLYFQYWNINKRFWYYLVHHTFFVDVAAVWKKKCQLQFAHGQMGDCENSDRQKGNDQKGNGQMSNGQIRDGQ